MSNIIENRLRDIAERKTALNKIGLVFTAESLLDKLEEEVVKAEEHEAKRLTFEAKLVAQEQSEREALSTFDVGDCVSWVYARDLKGRDKRHSGTVVEIAPDDRLGPCLKVSTGDIGEKLIGLLSTVHPLKDKAEREHQGATA